MKEKPQQRKFLEYVTDRDLWVAVVVLLAAIPIFTAWIGIIDAEITRSFLFDPADPNPKNSALVSVMPIVFLFGCFFIIAGQFSKVIKKGSTT